MGHNRNLSPGEDADSLSDKDVVLTKEQERQYENERVKVECNKLTTPGITQDFMDRLNTAVESTSLTAHMGHAIVYKGMLPPDELKLLVKPVEYRAAVNPGERSRLVNYTSLRHNKIYLKVL